MDFSFSDLNLQLDGQLPINFNLVEKLPASRLAQHLPSILRKRLRGISLITRRLFVNLRYDKST